MLCNRCVGVTDRTATWLSFPRSSKLAQLNGDNGFKIRGPLASAASTYSVSGIGDINGDGFDDVIVGSRHADPNGLDSGSSYVIFGKADGFAATVNLSALNGASGFRLDGEVQRDLSGFAVSGAGDFNGDGIADFLVGAPNATSSDPLATGGMAFLVFGKAGGFDAVIQLADLDGNDGKILIAEAIGESAGFSLAAAGDVNGDGLDDIIIGAPYGISGPRGSAYVVFGSESGPDSPFVLSDLDGDNGFRILGTAAADRVGYSVSGAGDINGDGFDDLVVGSQIPTSSAINGRTYVIFGKAGGFDATINLATLAAADGFRIIGGEDSDFTARSVAIAGDINGDGFDDLIIGAEGSDIGGQGSGTSYVLFGKAGGFGASVNLSTINGNNGFRILGDQNYDQSGFSVAAAGDVNGDGFDDVIVGAPSAPNGLGTGAAYVVFGKAGGFNKNFNLATLNGNNGFKIEGVASGDGIGSAVKSAGDVNGDGFGDLILGADQNGESGARAAYVVFGRAPTTSVNRTGTSADQTIAGGDFADTISGLGGADDLYGNGGIDRLDGGAGNDTITGGGGRDVMAGGTGADNFDFNAIGDSKLNAQRDVISDFNAGTGATAVDLIDLSGIDAKSGVAGNQKFKFIGDNDFHDVKGELQLSRSGNTVIVAGDVNGDGNADFEIGLSGFANLTKFSAIDFIL